MPARVDERSHRQVENGGGQEHSLLRREMLVQSLGNNGFPESLGELVGAFTCGLGDLSPWKPRMGLLLPGGDVADRDDMGEDTDPQADLEGGWWCLRWLSQSVHFMDAASTIGQSGLVPA